MNIKNMKPDMKPGRYHRVQKQLAGLMMKSHNPISRMATIIAVLHHKFGDYFWTGFYVENKGVLQVGPYQGPLACQELTPGKGVCWEAYSNAKTIVVPDVRLFPGHIACNALSKSEIVVPVFDKANKVFAVLDIDSKQLNSFDDKDALGLEEIVKLLTL